MTREPHARPIERLYGYPVNDRHEVEGTRLDVLLFVVGILVILFVLAASAPGGGA